MKHKLLLLLAAAFLLPGLCHAEGCTHENTQLRNAAAATCIKSGYSGDIFCLDCNITIQVGGTVTKGIHQLENEPRGAKVPTCTEPGYTGDIYCRLCSIMAIPGHEIPTLDHLAGEPVYKFAYDPSCTREGRTPSVSCKICLSLIKRQEKIPPLGHDIADPQNYVAPSCTVEGSCDGYCSRCESDLKDAVLYKVPHAFENHICTTCGWAEPGLYDQNGQLISLWDDLVANGFVRQYKRDIDFIQYEIIISAISPELTGRLVYPEGFKIEPSLIKHTALTEVWIPQDVTYVSDYADCPSLEKLRFFCSGELRLNDCANNPKLQEVVFSPTCELRLGEYAFENCPALTKIVIPDSLVSLGDSFSDADNLTVCYRGTQEQWEAVVSSDAAVNVVYEYNWE